MFKMNYKLLVSSFLYNFNLSTNSHNCCDLCDEISSSNTTSNLASSETKSNTNNECIPQDKSIVIEYNNSNNNHHNNNSNNNINSHNNNNTHNDDNSNPRIDLSYEVHILLYTIIDCNEMYGLGTQLVIYSMYI